MELKNQVCTIEQSKRLVELGVFEPCLFVHFTAGSHSGIALGGMYKRHIWILTGVAYEDDEINIKPAYTVAELGVMLPDDYLRADIDKSMKYGYAIGVWPTNVRGNWGKRTEYNGECTFHPTEAQARAAMLIHLLETKLITPEQVNASLTQQQ